jgi:hypothetical protein
MRNMQVASEVAHNPHNPRNPEEVTPRCPGLRGGRWLFDLGSFRLALAEEGSTGRGCLGICGSQRRWCCRSDSKHHDCYITCSESLRWWCWTPGRHAGSILTFSKRAKSNRNPGSSLMFFRSRRRNQHPGSNLMFSLGRMQWKMSTFGVKLNTCFLSNTHGCRATNCVGVVHDQASSPLRFLMASTPPAEDGAELNMVVFVRWKG